MSEKDESYVGRLAQILQRIEAGEQDIDASDLSNEEAEQLKQARRALARIDRMSEMALRTTGTTSTLPPPQSDTPHAKPDNAEGVCEKQEVVNLTGEVSLNDHSLPKEFGRFIIDRVLGRGGFGVVLLAEDPKLNQQVALKIPRTELLLSDEGRERLMREARAATILAHPNIVPVYESGLVGVVPYISFGYCSGSTLAKWLDVNQAKMSHRLAARIAARLAEALQHAHSRGIVHRDLKPDNVMLSQPLQVDAGEEELLDVLRIADFGLATSTSTDQSLTKIGSPIGTPAFMSPEQAKGEKDVGPTSDIFSLGVMLYEMLTATQPFKRQSDIATLQAVEQSHPAEPSNVSPRVPKDLSAIVQKCLQKRPDDRYDSAQDLGSDLQRFLDLQPVHARPVRVGTRFVRWCVRNPAITACLSIAFVSLVTGLAFSLSYARASNVSERAAILSSQEADRRYNDALALSGLFHTTYDSFREIIQDDLTGDDDKTKQLKSKLVDATKEHYQLVAAQRPTDREVLREYVNMLRPMAYQLQLLGDQQTSAKIWKEAADILESEFPDEVLEWAAVTGKLVEDYTTVRRVDDAVATANRVVTKLVNLGDLDQEDHSTQTQLVHALTNSALAFKGYGRYPEANAILNDAKSLVCHLEDCETQNWPVNKTWARLIRTKCEVIGHLERYDELLFLAPLGIAQYETLRENPRFTDLALDSIPTFYDSLGVVLAEKSEYDEAIEHFEKGLALREELIERHPQMGWLYFNAANAHQRIAQVLNQSGDHAGAIHTAEGQIARISKLTNRFTELKPAFEQQLLEAYWVLGSAFYGADQTEEAIEAAEAGIELVKRVSGEDPIPLPYEGRLGTLYSIQAFASQDPEVKTDRVAKAILHLQHAIENGGSLLYQVDLDSALKLRDQLGDSVCE